MSGIDPVFAAVAKAVDALEAAPPAQVEWKKSPFLEDHGNPLKCGSLHESVRSASVYPEHSALQRGNQTVESTMDFRLRMLGLGSPRVAQLADREGGGILNLWSCICGFTGGFLSGFWQGLKDELNGRRNVSITEPRSHTVHAETPRRNSASQTMESPRG